MGRRSRRWPLALALATASLAAPGNAQAIGVTGISDQGVAHWGPNPATYFSAVTGSVGQLRLIVPWDVGEQPGSTASQNVTDWINAANLWGKRIIISFDHEGGCDASHPGCPPPSAAAYASAVHAFRVRWPSIAEFTPWNEPNHHDFGTDGVDSNPADSPELAAAYWNMLINECIHQSATGVICGAAAGDFLDGSGSGLSSYMSRYKGALSPNTPSIWAVHPYTAINSGDSSSLRANFFSQVGSTQQVWFTEAGGFNCVGHTNFGDAAQNAAAQSLLNLAASDARIQRVYWYQLADANFDANGCIWDTDLVDRSGTPRPALATLFPSTRGMWWGVRNQNASGAADGSVVFTSTGTPFAGDWNGDGVDTPGVFNNGLWALRATLSSGGSDNTFGFGNPGDVPFAGDWNGDGVDTPGLYRPSTGQWFLRNSNTPGGADVSFALGNPGDVPVAGDWNGDGVDTPGVFRPSTAQWFLRNSNTSGGGDISFAFGNPGDTPLVGDWNGDGIDTPGVYRPGSPGQWFLRNSNTSGGGDVTLTFGSSGDTPVIGDWNGDGVDSPGVVR
jgi:hypothetical protein